MSIYKSSDSYIKRKLAEVSEVEQARRRLEIDFTDLLIGPTCGGEADRLVKLRLKSASHMELAARMQEAAERYIESVRQRSKE
jgi:hypothetical protein